MRSWLVITALILKPLLHAGEVETHVYIEHPSGPLRLDIHHPNVGKEEPSPCILWFHGGGWRNGSRENMKMLSWVVEHGYAIVSIDYRLTGTAIFPAQKSDGIAALAWIHRNGREHGINPDRIVVAGLSAGAHLASLIGFSTDEDPNRIHGIIHFYGPSDFILTSRYAKSLDSPHNQPDSNVYQLLGGPLRDRQDLAEAASPVHYLDPDDPPCLILVGDEDTLMTQRQCRHLLDRALESGVRSEFHLIQGAGHGGPEFSDPERRQLILTFLQSLDS